MAGFHISFETDISSLAVELPKWANQRIPSITRNALNDVVKLAWQGERDRIRGVFDRPTPYIQKAPLYERATKETLTAEVYIPEVSTRGGTPKAKILAAQVRGGSRRAKGFELMLRRAGLMRSNEYAVPGRDTPLDNYGNVRRSLITRIVNQMGKRRRGGYRYFVPKPGSRLARGVWEEMRGRKVRPVLLFVTDAPDYRKHYPFGERAIDVARREFAPSWQHYWQRELTKHQTAGR